MKLIIWANYKYDSYKINYLMHPIKKKEGKII